jgi:hypothetical protein
MSEKEALLSNNLIHLKRVFDKLKRYYLRRVAATKALRKDNIRLKKSLGDLPREVLRMKKQVADLQKRRGPDALKRLATQTERRRVLGEKLREANAIIESLGGAPIEFPVFGPVETVEEPET